MRLFELPHVVAMSRENLAHKFPAPGSGTSGGSATGPAAHGDDAFLLANVSTSSHGTRPRPPGARTRQRAARGALAVVEFWTNPTQRPAVFAALMAGEWPVGRGEGDIFREDEICDLLPAAGSTMTARRPLAGPANLVVADAIAVRVRDLWPAYRPAVARVAS